MFDDEEGKEDKSRVTHDGRQLFYKVFYYNLLEIRKSMLVKDFDSWYRLLRSLYTQVYPFLSLQEATSLNVFFSDAEVKLEQYYVVAGAKTPPLSILRRRRENELSKVLDGLEREIFVRIKDKGMLLPSSMGDDDDFDESDIDEESG